MSLQTRLTALVQAIGADIKSLNTRLATHKYHAFSNNEYYHDNYEQGNYFRLFTENATFSETRFRPIYNVEYWNGSAWVEWTGGLEEIKKLLDGRENTGINLSHTYRRFRFTVHCASGWPTKTICFLQTTWTGFNYPTTTVSIEESSTLGGAYTLRDTAIFGSGTTGANFGIHAKVVGSLHNGQPFRRITIDVTDWVDSGSYTTVPLRRFEILSNYGGGSLIPFSWDYAKRVSFEGAVNTAGTLSENGNRVYSSANPPTGFLPSGGKAADSELLDGIDSLEFLRKGHSDASGSRNTKAVSSLNDRLVSGWYDGNNMTGAPSTGWWLVQVIAHSNGAHWQRQIAYSMTTETTTQSVYSRRCNGPDPSVAGSWTAWERIDVGRITDDITLDAGGPTTSADEIIDAGALA